MGRSGIPAWKTYYEDVERDFPISLRVGAVESSYRAPIFVLLLFLSMTLFFAPTPAKATLTFLAHAPIAIRSELGFLNVTNGVTGGNGTPTSPYIIEGWNITASTTAGILIMNTQSYFIIRNVIIHPANFTSTSSGILLENVANGQIQNVKIANFENGIQLLGSQNIITQTTAWNNTVGIFMTGSGNLISLNQIHNNTKYGIWLTGSTANTFTNNNSSKNGNGICEAIVNPCDGEGFVIAGSTNNVFENNTATGNSYYGFRLVLGSNNNLVTNNTIAKNQYGLTVSQGSGNQLVGNLLTKNDFGIGLEVMNINNNVTQNRISNSNQLGVYVTNSSRNFIYNNFLNNTGNAFDDSNQNYWNITKTLRTNILGGPFTGGNFYSTGYQGNDPDGDGIGDTPYPIQGSTTVDQLPLVKNQPVGGIVHDIAVKGITAQPASTRAGHSISVTVAVFNQGTVPESFDVTASYNQTIFNRRTITNLPAWSGTTYSFPWDTSGLSTGFYILKANATIVSGESYTVNNISPPTTIELTANQPPIAVFSVSSASITAGNSITLDASNSYDPDGTVASYSWNFGDGTSGTGTTASHAYTRIGTFTITLTVTDNEGAISNPTTKSVTVLSNQPGTPLSLQISATSGQAILTWSAPTSTGGSPIIGYNIYRGTSASNLVLLKNWGNTTRYLDGSVSGGQTYYYRVTTINSAGSESAPSLNSVLVPNSPSSGSSNLPAIPLNLLLIGIGVVVIAGAGTVGVLLIRRRSKTVTPQA